MQLLHIRFLQLKRELGLWFFIIVGLAIYFSVSFVSENQTQNIAFASLIVFGIGSFHQKRGDLNFIKKYFNASRQQLLLNYNLTLLPLSIGFFVNGQVVLGFSIHLAVSALAFMGRRSYSLKLVWLTKSIPAPHFEWMAGLRGNFPILLALLIIMILLSPVKLFAIAALFLFNITLLGFYSVNEPRVMLNPQYLPVNQFLNRKILFSIKVILLFNLPVLLVNSVFQPDVVGFNLFFLIGFVLLAAASVCIKYVNYQPNSSTVFNVDMIILVASVIIPFLLPLSIYLYFSNRKKALQNLLIYCDDTGTNI